MSNRRECRIARIDTYVVGAKWCNWVFAHVFTDDGLEGIGEGTCEFQPKAVEAAIQQLARRVVVGQSAFSIERLWQASREVLAEWTALRIAETGEGFPEKVTAFHPRMSVHGRFGQPCPVCSAPIQRIVYSERETNYCPRCQTGGRILADRALSRLLGEDRPRTLEDLDEG